MDETRKVAEFVVRTDFERIPQNVQELAAIAILDCIGVTLAGSREESTRICAEAIQEERGIPASTVIGQGFKASTLFASLCNGIAAHALDYDHSSFLMGQPTAGLIPAILTLAERVGASGREVLEAFVVGTEVTARLVRTIPEHSSQGGWHSTGTIGTLGVAVACSKLLKLEHQAIVHALGIASSMACGMVSNFGTMTKPLHAGLASKNGLLAALLAGRGFTANPDSLSGLKGFFDVYAGSLPYDPEPLSSLGVSYDLAERGIKIKPYPCGGLTHAAIDALLHLRNQYGIAPERVESITVNVTRRIFDKILDRLPESELEGKFSIPYLMARALHDGHIDLESFSLGAIRDPEVRSSGEKVRMQLDPQFGANWSHASEVTVRLTDGGVFSRHVEFPRGGPEIPLSAAELRAKFIDCAGRALNAQTIDKLLGMLEQLAGIETTAPIYPLLIGCPEQSVALPDL